MSETLTALTGRVTAAALVNVRKDAPNTKATISRQLEKDATFDIIGTTAGERVAGEDNWYVGPDAEYVWAGAVRAPESGFADDNAELPVLRRADGTIKNLSAAKLAQLYGDFKWTEGKGGAIVPDPVWVKASIVKLVWPGVEGGQGATLWVHKKAKPYFERAIAAIAAASLTDRVVTFDGSWVPRHIRWTPGKPLSSHSWGVAIDINVRWNGVGVTPPAVGAVGSLRELVPFFEAQGFAWGGRFQPDELRDGMHFELARLDV
jgi:hypothetical protein